MVLLRSPKQVPWFYRLFKKADILPFPKPPITEAVLDIRVELPQDVDLNTLSLIHNEINACFPLKEERFSWKGGFQVRKGAAPEILQPSGGPDGYLFRSPDKNKVVQVRTEGFTFNKLKPYERWSTFSSEAKELWQVFAKIAKPKTITRLALRYVNRIEIPLPINNLKEYVLTLPEISPGLDNTVQSYFMTLEVVSPKIDICGTIIQTFKPIQEVSKILPLIFDIDVYKKIKLEPLDNKVWDVMEELRQFKNKVFLESLTEKAKELFR